MCVGCRGMGTHGGIYTAEMCERRPLLPPAPQLDHDEAERRIPSARERRPARTMSIILGHIEGFFELAFNSSPQHAGGRKFRRVVVSGAGEEECNGVYVECGTCGDKPTFVYAGRTRHHAPIVLEFTTAGAAWSLRKEGRRGSTRKNWYTASASTGAMNFDWRTDSMPPATGWAVSTEFAKYVAADLTSSIEPPPTIVELSESEPIPDDVARDMLLRGMKYTAERE